MKIKKINVHLTEEQVEELADELEECARISSSLDMRMQAVREQIYKDGRPTKGDNMPFSLPVVSQLAQTPLLKLLGDGTKK